MQLKQNNGNLQITVPYPSATYLNACMRANCFEELHDLFKHAHAPAKEFTESYAALVHLRPYLVPNKKNYVLHVGDGAHCRTAALFSFFASNTINISIDPNIREELVFEWKKRWDVQRFYHYKGKIEDYIDFLPEHFQMKPAKTFATFVHSHVNTDEILNRFHWNAIYVNPCCKKDVQLSVNEEFICKEDDDWCILSPERHFQVLKYA